MPGWWQSYGFVFDPFPRNKPLSSKEEDLLVRTRSIIDLLEYFHLDRDPFQGIMLVHGTFGFGKTTLLRFIEGQLQRNLAMKTSWVDARLSADTYDDFRSHIVGSIYQSVVDPDAGEIDPTSAMKSILKNPRDTHCSILIDELHKVKEEYVFRFLSDHQAFLEGLKDLPITLVMAGQDELAGQLEGRGGITGVFDVEIPILPMNEMEAVELLERRMKKVCKSPALFRNPFTKGAISRLVDIAEGNPRFILKRAKRILQVNSVLPPPIIIDEIAVARAEEDVKGEDLIGIRKAVGVQEYLPVRRKLAKLFSQDFGSPKHHDYLAVLQALYDSGETPLDFETLENSADCLGDLTRVLKELNDVKVLSLSVARRKHPYGVVQTRVYLLDDRVRKFFSFVLDKYGLHPAAYLERIFSPSLDETLAESEPDPTSGLYEDALSLTQTPEAAKFLQQSIELRYELNEIESPLLVSQSVGLILQFVLKAYNVHTRGNPGTSIEENLSHLLSDVASKEMTIDPGAIKSALESVQKYRHQLELGDDVSTKETQRVLENGLEAYDSILKAHIEYSTEKTPAAIETSEKDLSRRIESIEELLEKLRADYEEMKLKASVGIGDAKERCLAKIMELVADHSHLQSSKVPLFLRGFLKALDEADSTISRAIGKNNKHLIASSVVRSMDMRFFPTSYEPIEESLIRKQSLYSLTNCFEEFLRFAVLCLPEGDLKNELSEKETTIGRILGRMLGPKWYGRMMKYNSGDLAKPTDEGYRDFVNKISELIEVKDEKLAELPIGQIHLVLLTLVRNFEDHTVRNVNISDDYYHSIYDRILLGFLGFYELVVHEYLPAPRIAVPCLSMDRGVGPFVAGKNVTLSEPLELTAGSFLIGKAVLMDDTEILIIPETNEIHLVGLKDGIDTSLLPDYDKACLGLPIPPMDDFDEDLFAVKLKWYDEKNWNNAVRNGEIAFFDGKHDSGELARSSQGMANCYAICFQSRLAQGRFAVLTPVRFFPSFQDLVGFLKFFPVEYQDLPPYEKNQLEKLLTYQPPS